jgi:sigma-E factor negative regulatory protein RseA
MSEELDSQLSAMFDDELPQGECELLARRLSRDMVLQARWGRYAAIGAAVRGGDVRLAGAVARKVNAALLAEPVSAGTAAIPAPRTRSQAGNWRRTFAGAALAAGVAAVSILWLHGSFTPGDAPLVARTSGASAAASLPTAASYVVPQTVEARVTVLPATELANYVVAHSEFSTPVSRGNLLSAFMASESAAVNAPQPQAGSLDDPNHHADAAP